MTNTAGWAGSPATQTHYFVVLPGDKAAADGHSSSMTFKAPDLQYNRSGYWSLTVYDAEGWVATEPFKISSREIKPNEDGTFTINFNGPKGSINNLIVPKNWNALFRCYLPASLDSILAFEKEVLTNSKPLSIVSK